MRRWITITLVVWGTVLPGCGKDGEGSKETGPQSGPAGSAPAAAQNELVVLCGNSFTPPAEELVRQFQEQSGVKVSMTFGGSEDFLPLIKVGKKGDILITHDPYLDYVRDAKSLAEHAQVGFVAPVLAVAKGNPKALRVIADLGRPGLRVALSDPKYSTCGEIVANYLEKKGLKEAVMANVGNRLVKGHGDLGKLLKTGVVDAVIMWNGVAHTFAESLDVVPNAFDYDLEVRGVHVIGLSYSKQPALVSRFIEFANRRGPDVFARHGYVK